MKNKEKEIELFTELFSECEENIIYLIINNIINLDIDSSKEDAIESLESLKVAEEAIKRSSRPQEEKDVFLEKIANYKEDLNKIILIKS